MSLHNEIMALGCRCNEPQAIAYKIGHKDARHAAAELAVKADAEIARLNGESAVLRDLLRSALPIVETVSDDDSDDWMMAIDLAARIKAAIDGQCGGLLEDAK